MRKTILAMTLAMIGTAAHAMDAGRYEQKISDGSTDVLVLSADGDMSLKLTRQVGGPGGISEAGVVPYPTVCRVKQWGTITSEDANFVQYDVKFVELVTLTGLRDSEHCAEYVAAFNALIQSQGISFSLNKSEYGLTK